MNHTISPVGYIRSPYKEKFAVPRQPGLAPSAVASVALTADANNEDTVRGLEQFSHLWLLFLFDQNIEKGWTPTVRPPRLGGNERIGVFASRATFRPNGIGMSAVPLKEVRKERGQIFIDIGSCDLVDGTPIVDIKPYIPYSDAIPNSAGGYASEPPVTLNVIFEDKVSSLLAATHDGQYQRDVIKEVLAQDPRPAYKKGKTDDKEYGVHLFDWNVRFRVSGQDIRVTALEDFGE
ncbi:tRNA (N6-threonylcarbamoyladenosine(37)-N6)-methyltransferase TrmO [Veronia nyctiphanis]|uniref:tRNA (N6-threonylcarbamoyladenosine(37)-N6)-methyltransferase TrmO n=1 Tax=Veronia nyctiphanis TaxID=1278244 RepID=A0A4Q0YNG4_9GAMM|nr:tRNA (N6-threonylcarbamoyladenosine(37)-N6)-methyltransferase TrmO [Veronia nyctiphanis]RXJ72492.1 tRNA (N6-threonylcarbamoyladenosine(37)-N6)-methyltransferase TrmO [Veronia nyctiphanis]